MPRGHNKVVQGRYIHNEEWGNRKTIGFLDTKTTGKWYRASGFPQISGPTQSTPLPSLSLYIRDPIIPLLQQAQILLITVLFATLYWAKFQKKNFFFLGYSAHVHSFL